MSSGLWQRFSLSLIFHDLDRLWSTGQVWCTITPYSSFSDVFVVFRLGLWVMGGRMLKVKCPSFSPDRIGSTWHQHDLSLVTMTPTWPITDHVNLDRRHLHCEVIISPFPDSALRKSLSPVHCQKGEGKITLYFLERVIYIYYLDSSVRTRFVSSPLFIYLFNHFFISASIHVQFTIHTDI